MSKYDDLVKKLKEIFQIDRPELDFGVYRILNSRVAEINDYLEKRLKAKVTESLAVSGAASLESLRKELKEKEAQYRADDIDPDAVPKIVALRKKLAELSGGTAEHENSVFTHLLTFFSRYYDKGDFISQRRYKGDTYAIPYAGEEVVLHWANKDQYYTKSGENFANYALKLDDGRTVRFRLVTADTAKDNRKDNDKERRFVLIEKHTRTLTDEDGEEYEEELLPVAEENGELVLRFEYKAMPKGSKQEALVARAVEAVLGDSMVKACWLDLSKREPTEKNPQRTLLEKCLVSYTTKNTADYFIHKDLGGFLRRELDFYIKNEVMNLDDVQHAGTFASIEMNLRLIQTLRAIALNLITFLAQLEDFQKKLWLKKKFVVASHYCLTLDRLPESLYLTIAANPQQWEQWDKLGMLEQQKQTLSNHAKVGSVEYLKEHPYLMADTALFGDAFKDALLAAVDNLDDSLDGLLIHGDNFQALNLLQERYREQVKCVYIDPPYNTENDEFVYKDSYRHSSWASFLEGRIESCMPLINNKGVFLCSLDDLESSLLRNIFENISRGQMTRLGEFVWKTRNTDNRIVTQFSQDHEYIHVWASTAIEGRIIDRSNFRNPDNDPRGPYVTDPLTGKANKQARPNLHYTIVNPDTGDVYLPDYDFGWITNEAGFKKLLADNRIHWPSNPRTGKPRKKRFQDEMNERAPVSSLAISITQGEGNQDLLQLFGEKKLNFPKPTSVLQNLVDWSVPAGKLILDYFAGSGTTGHAVISLNRQDRGQRKYILVEQGEYFDTVLKPRIQKVVYSADWKDGKATAPQTGISHAFKVLKIESYEDTLNNLQLRRTEKQQSLLDSLPPAAQEEYLLRYLLDIESRGALLPVEQFNKPFACKLKVTVDSAGAYEERTIDLVETFNYLIGLRVKHIDMQRDKGFVTVTGWLPTGEKTLILWRDTETVDYETLNRLCDKLAINPADSEYEVIYINGDHNIPAVFTSLESEGGISKTLKIRQIEPEFLSRMFAVEGV
ncbi:MAG: site-specific DNA-methyltransferase [Syntrophales bacterium]|nr:site-specific DNA-methyltransferase [Syntrophales bacterium]